MNEADALAIVQSSVWVAILMSAPLVVPAMLVGIAIAFVQALTQVQEATLTFVPKILVVFFAAIVSGTFIAGQLSILTDELFLKISTGF